MLESAYVMGLTTKEFWDMTFLEFEIYGKAYELKKKDEVHLQILNAYMTESFHRTKKLPKIEDLFKEEEEEEITDDRLFEKVKSLHNKFMKGGK